MSVIIDGSAGVTTNAGGSVNPSTNIDGINYSCRAWVNFNGTGTPAIRASGNVTSITDNGTGDYTLNFTTAMTDANYAPVTASQYARIICSVGTLTTSAAQIRTYDEGGAANFDANPILVAVFR
jgi:hypothetical protein